MNLLSGEGEGATGSAAHRDRSEDHWAKQAVAVVYPCPNTLPWDDQQVWTEQHGSLGPVQVPADPPKGHSRTGTAGTLSELWGHCPRCVYPAGLAFITATSEQGLGGSGTTKIHQ